MGKKNRGSVKLWYYFRVYFMDPQCRYKGKTCYSSFKDPIKLIVVQTVSVKNVPSGIFKKKVVLYVIFII